MSPEPNSLPGKGGARGGGFAAAFTRILAALVALAVLVVGAMFSLVVIAIAVVVGLVAFGWMWWKIRRVMKQAREDPRFQEFANQARRGGKARRGDIIEGEVIHKDD
ncbi:MAG: hypothetical protein WDO12_07020 [Pseudomonadota bacterium]